MAITDKLKAIADAIRGKTGKSELLTLDEMPSEISQIDGSYDDTQTYILVDESGNEIPAVLVDEEVELTATPNDIRMGSVAVTDDGVVTGTKEIPSYHVTEGAVLIPAGSNYSFRIPKKNRYDYTKLQAIICVFNNTISDSVNSEKVCINNKIYPVGSDVEISTITLNHDEQQILLGIVNDEDTPRVLRYFTYKEEP